MKTQLKGLALVTIALCLSPCTALGGSDTTSAPSSQIEDGLTAIEFREYGQTSPTRLSTRMGDLEFTEGGFAGGYPTNDSIAKLRDELDYQRATQAYIWATPLVSYSQWLKAHEQHFGAKDGDTHWDQLLVTSHDDRDQHFDQMYRRAAFTYEAVTRGKAYYIEKAGIGQQYRTGYKDDDGSVTVYFSPELPEGVDKQNWLQTNPGESWFSYLRFYGPTEAYFDETYPLENIKRVK